MVKVQHLHLRTSLFGVSRDTSCRCAAVIAAIARGARFCCTLYVCSVTKTRQTELTESLTDSSLARVVCVLSG